MGTLAPAGIAQRRIDPVDVRLHRRARSFVDDFASHCIAYVGLRVTRRRQLAPDAVDAFAQDDLNAVGALVQDHDVEELPAFGYAYLDFSSFMGSPLVNLASPVERIQAHVIVILGELNRFQERHSEFFE